MESKKSYNKKKHEHECNCSTMNRVKAVGLVRTHQKNGTQDGSSRYSNGCSHKRGRKSNNEEERFPEITRRNDVEEVIVSRGLEEERQDPIEL